MREIHPDRIWIGNAINARDLRSLHDAGVHAVVDLALEEAPAGLGREMIYCRVPLLDGAGNSPEVLSLAIRTTVDLIRSNTPTLIACSAGMSRSPTIAAAALSIVDGVPLRECLEQIVAGRPRDVSPAFLESVENVANRLRGNSL